MSIISQTKKKMLQEIKDNTFHGYILSKKIDIPISSVYEHLKELREAGLIEYKEDGRRKIYRLTEKGQMLLKAIE